MMSDDYAKQLEKLKVLAGIYQPYNPKTENKEENLSHIGTNKGAYQRKNNIEPGTKEWFKLWFSRRVTGESPMAGDKK